MWSAAVRYAVLFLGLADRWRVDSSDVGATGPSSSSRIAWAYLLVTVSSKDRQKEDKPHCTSAHQVSA